MSNLFNGNVSKIYDVRAKIEKEFCSFYESSYDAIQQKAMLVKVDGLANKCKDLPEICTVENDSLVGLA